MNEPGERPLPQGLTALGYAGLLPFAACVLAVALLEGEARAFAVRALVAYGAGILSFLGAVHWGLLLRQPDAAAPVRLAIGVLPSLTGWLALLLPDRYALALLVEFLRTQPGCLGAHVSGSGATVYALCLPGRPQALAEAVRRQFDAPFWFWTAG